jgi:putative transcriptional regulator
MTVIIQLRRLIAEREMKLNRSVSLAEIAEAVGISRQAMSNIANGDVKHMPLDTLNALCNVLGCTPNDILLYTPDADVKVLYPAEPA